MSHATGCSTGMWQSRTSARPWRIPREEQSTAQDLLRPLSGLLQDFLARTFSADFLTEFLGVPHALRRIVPTEIVMERDVVSRTRPHGLGVVGCLGVAAAVLTLSPAWFALSCAVGSAAGWCWWLEQADLVARLNHRTSGAREPAPILDGRTRFGRARSVHGTHPGCADIVTDSAGSAGRQH